MQKGVSQWKVKASDVKKIHVYMAFPELHSEGKKPTSTVSLQPLWFSSARLTEMNGSYEVGLPVY